MRIGWGLAAGFLAVASAHAQTPPPAPLDPIIAASPADVQALIARAKATIKPGQPALIQPLLRVAPYRAVLEYRVAATPANAHVGDNEFVYVIQGGGTVVLGGTIADAKPVGRNIIGTTIEGGSARHLAPGDVLLIPAGVPHWFNAVEGTLVMVSMHVPQQPVQ